MFDEPLHPGGEVRERGHRVGPDGRDRGQRQQPHHGAGTQRDGVAAGAQDVVVEAVPLVPQPLVVERRADQREVLEELGRQVLVDPVVTAEGQRHLQQVLAVHGHPRGSIGLLQHAVDGQLGAVEGADVVQPQEAALEQVVALDVLAVDPPVEVEQQLVQHSRQEVEVVVAGDLVHAQRGPGVDRRVDVGEVPLVGGELAVGVHVPLAAEQDELGLGELRVDVGQGDAVEGQVPGGVPRVLPLVRHRDDVAVVEVRPLVVATGAALGRGRGVGRVALQPAAHVEVEELLGPQHPGERLAQDERLVGRGRGRGQLGVEGVGLARREGS